MSRASLIREGSAESWGTADWQSAHLHELGRLAALALPLVASALSSHLIPMISVAFVGHVGSHELSVVVLGSSFFNVTGLSFLIGSLGALETLCGQAYGGKEYKAVGVALQRSLLVTMLLCGLVAAGWTQMERIMLLLGQNPVLAADAAQFLIWNIPSLFFLGATECMKRYLMAQSVVAPATFAAAIAAAVALVANYVYISTLRWGIFGASMANNIAQLAPLSILVGYAVWRERQLRARDAPEQTWPGWSKGALQQWGAYFLLAGPSAAMLCLEWWTFEACVVMSGWLSNPELDVSVMGLTMNLSALLYMMPQGLSSATSVRVGNALGAGLPRAAQRAALTATLIIFVLQCGMAAATVASRNVAGLVFTQDAAVLKAAAPLFALMAWCTIGDGLNAVMGGVLRGAGRQELGACINLVAYWCVGLPLAWLLAFKAGLGLAGLWTGLASCASLSVSDPPATRVGNMR